MNNIYKMEPVELDLGKVIDKYVSLYGASEAIGMYNKFAIKTIKKGKLYKQQEYIKTADRFMSLMFFIKSNYVKKI